MKVEWIYRQGDLRGDKGRTACRRVGLLFIFGPDIPERSCGQAR